MNLSATTPATPRQVATAGLKAAFGILDKWGCSPLQAQKILRISKPAYYKYRTHPEMASLDSDQLDRISYLLNIHAALRTIFDNPENVYGFMGMANDNPYFNGAAPLDLIGTGQFAALYETFKRIDALRGGLW
ncbi:MAG: MbcA/ParS/Xre antitoxin family protein [Gammaproteobacteria bacterium]|nr:MbcA/ParS/Xre antitoxin family protein [Gammaproteobacteria bacterium]